MGTAVHLILLFRRIPNLPLLGRGVQGGTVPRAVSRNLLDHIIDVVVRVQRSAVREVGGSVIQPPVGLLTQGLPRLLMTTEQL